jgi:predicted outer membrane repeat protein
MGTLKNFMAASRKANIIPFGLLPANWDISWIENNAGGSGGGIQAVNDFTSLLNGSLQDFTLTMAPSGTGKLQVYWNGMGLRLNGASGFTNSGTSLHLNVVPQVGDTLVVFVF